MRDLGLYCCEAPADTPSLAVPLLSRFAPRAGLVILRQTFARRSHLLMLAGAPSGITRTACRRTAMRRRARPRWRRSPRDGGKENQAAPHGRQEQMFEPGCPGV